MRFPANQEKRVNLLTMQNRLVNFHQLVPFHKKVYYKWKSLRGVPFRNKFFIGYDLDGNTYWELITDKAQFRPRRLFEPRTPQHYIHHYFDMIPIQWAQWLRYSRKAEPSLEELAKEEIRVQQLQAVVSFKEQEQKWNSSIAEQRINDNLLKELKRVDEEKKLHEEVSKDDPWAAAREEENKPPASTSIQPGRRG